MEKWLICMLFLLVGGMPAMAQDVAPNSPSSSTDANTPDAKSFDTIMQHDLLLYGRDVLEIKKPKVDYRLLRNAAQASRGYPKYYIWLRVYDGVRLHSEGAARLVAIEGRRFEVTNFMPKESIKLNPEGVATFFPESVVQSILSMADAEN